jgi:CelD/BcsL family acetyltransferase involved in cellulose biosynthesis
MRSSTSIAAEECSTMRSRLIGNLDFGKGVHALDSGRVSVRLWSEEEFEASTAAWQELLQRSDADPLFMSWQWQWLWWRHLGRPTGAVLNLLAAYSERGELVGLAPLTLRKFKHRGGLSGQRLETLGSRWRDHVEVFSEYLDFIVDRRHMDAVLCAYEQALAMDKRWDDLVIGFTRWNGAAQRLRASTLASRCYSRVADPMEAHSTSIPQIFDTYLKALDASTRRKLWNQRKKLANPTVTFAAAGDIGEYMDLIDGFLESRWGPRPLDGTSRNFRLEFAAAMADEQSLRLSCLSVNERPISVMYNIRRGGKEYNLQAAFDLANNSGISPGYLHFGYSLERACSDGMLEFDFLAGQGRNRQYKEDFRTRSEQIICIQFIRSRGLGAIYRAYDVFNRLRAAPRRSNETVEREQTRE